MKVSARSANLDSIAFGAIVVTSVLAVPAVASAAKPPAPGPGTTPEGRQHARRRRERLDAHVLAGGKSRPHEGRRDHGNADGKVIAMKEDLNWKQLRQFGTLSPKSR